MTGARRRSVSDWPLVGREAELQRVWVLLTADQPSSGVVLAGTTGVGKTRMGRECLALAAKAGYATAQVTATQAASGIPLGVLAPLLSPSLPVSPRSGGQPAMLQSAAVGVAERGGEKPLALLVDDAHLLDGASAALVHQLALMSRTFVILVVTLGAPAPDAVTALWKDGITERIDLAAISTDDVERLLPVVLGGPVDGSTLRYFGSHSAGNVLFLRHLVQGALEGGHLHDDEGVWRMAHPAALPSSLIELVEARLTGIGEAERTLLEAVACGEPVGVALLSDVCDLRQLETLERLSLVVITREGRRLVARLAHPLHGEVLRERAPTLRAESCRRLLAEAVEATGARRAEDLLRIATWRLEGGGPLSTDTALAAAHRARALRNLPLAEALSRHAVEGGAGFDARLLHAEVLDLLGRVDDAERELALLEPPADDDERVALALTRTHIVGFRQARIGEALRLCEQALALLARDRTDELAARYANLVMSVGDARTAIDLAEPLLARASGPALSEACEAAATGLIRFGRFADALDVSARGAAANLSGGGRPPVRSPAMHVLIRCEALCAGGRMTEAERVARDYYDRTVVEASTGEPGTAAWILGRVHIAQGRARSAARWTGEHLGLQSADGALVLRRYALVDRAQALAIGGQGAQAAAALEEADRLPIPDDGRWWVNHQRARAWTAVARHDVREALSLLREIARTGEGTGEPVPEAEALHDMARLGEAASVRRRLSELAGQIEGELAPARAAHAAALAANDSRALRTVADAFESMGAVLLAAEAAAAAAAVRLRAGDSREMLADERRALALRDLCEGAMTPALTLTRSGAILTNREREIAVLAADGHSNRAIAERLALSVRTVENQLQRVYEKLDIKGRTDLAHALNEP